jgi:hypothetical protein
MVLSITTLVYNYVVRTIEAPCTIVKVNPQTSRIAHGCLAYF